MTLLFQRVFVFKCITPVLRFTVLLSLLALPIPLTRLLCFYKRVRPPDSLLSPLPEALVLSAFPIAWFFGFLYYTDVPSLVSVISTVVAASENRHWTAALVRNLHWFETFRSLTDQIAWSHELHVSTNEHHLGRLCLCIQSANEPPLPTLPAR